MFPSRNAVPTACLYRAPQIINLSDLLLPVNHTSPPSDLILECIVIRKAGDAAFLQASRALAPPEGTVRIPSHTPAPDEALTSFVLPGARHP